MQSYFLWCRRSTHNSLFYALEKWNPSNRNPLRFRINASVLDSGAEQRIESGSSDRDGHTLSFRGFEMIKYLFFALIGDARLLTHMKTSTLFIDPGANWTVYGLVQITGSASNAQQPEQLIYHYTDQAVALRPSVIRTVTVHTVSAIIY